MDEIELYNNLNLSKHLGESFIDKIDVKSQSEQKIQNPKSKSSEWGFYNFNSKTKEFLETQKRMGQKI